MITVYSAQNVGLQATIISIEVDANRSLPGIDIVGLPDSSIKESKERIKSACRNSGISFEPRKYLVNLAPSNTKKYGSRFDLSIATGILLKQLETCKQQEAFLSTCLLFGELGLDGSVRAVDGLLPSVLSAKKQGRTNVIVPADCVQQIDTIDDITIFVVDSMRDMVAYLHGEAPLKKHIRQRKALDREKRYIHDDIYGHEFAKRVLEIASIGKHNVLLLGSPGTGKTILAKYFHALLSPLTYEESLQVKAIHALGTKNISKKNIISRPFIQAHNSVSYGGMFGGGYMLKPGLVSLAHNGVLFLDEIAEFKRDVLEGLRQPMEEKRISISRQSGSVVYPADCIVIGAMNPCKCGYFGDKNKQCSCSSYEVERYQSKISGPLLDRFDIIIDITRQDISLYFDRGKKKKSLTHLIDARAFYAKYSHKLTLSTDCKKNVKSIAKRSNLSGRVVKKLMDVAKSIACYKQKGIVETVDFFEAYQYRSIRLKTPV